MRHCGSSILMKRIQPAGVHVVPDQTPKALQFSIPFMRSPALAQWILGTANSSSIRCAPGRLGLVKEESSSVHSNRKAGDERRGKLHKARCAPLISILHSPPDVTPAAYKPFHLSFQQQVTEPSGISGSLSIGQGSRFDLSCGYLRRESPFIM